LNFTQRRHKETTNIRPHNHRHHEDLRRYLQRAEDLSWQGAQLLLYLRLEPRCGPLLETENVFANVKLFEQQGKLYVRGDSKIFRFQNGKTESLFLQRKNPRRIAWTVLYRRQHKKGISEVSGGH
jgi:ribosomal protein L24E